LILTSFCHYPFFRLTELTKETAQDHGSLGIIPFLGVHFGSPATLTRRS
jgi:hypothetical protein